MGSIQYSCGRDVYSCCQNLYDLCRQQKKVLDTEDKATREVAATVEAVKVAPKRVSRSTSMKSKVVKMPKDEIISASDLKLPEIFLYRKELAFLYIKGLKVQELDGCQTVSILQYKGLSNLFSKDKVLPLNSDDKVSINKCPRRVSDALKHINEILLPSGVIGCMYMKNDGLKVQIEDGYGKKIEYSYGESGISEYDVSKYVEVIFNSSLGKILGNIKYVYWLSKGDLRNFAIRKDYCSEEYIITFF